MPAAGMVDNLLMVENWLLMSSDTQRRLELALSCFFLFLSMLAT